MHGITGSFYILFSIDSFPYPINESARASHHLDQQYKPYCLDQARWSVFAVGHVMSTLASASQKANICPLRTRGQGRSDVHESRNKDKLGYMWE